MSFKLKIISLILSVSIIPYVILMLYLGSTLLNIYHQNTQNEMQTQLKLSVEQMEQYLQTLQRDMKFMIGLDVMNDIFGLDLDRRISRLLESKKRELNLIGEFHLKNSKNRVIASSNLQFLSQKSEYKAFFSYPIYSPFDKTKIGELELDFSLDNLKRFFNNKENRQYYILLNEKETLYKSQKFAEVLKVSQKLKSNQNIEIILEEDKTVFLKELKRYQELFVVALLIGVLIIALIALFFTRRLIKPVIELSHAANAITKKQDYSYQVDVHSNDEIGKLSSSFNTMITGMSNALTQLKEESENRIKLTQEQSKNEMLEELSSKLSKYLSPQIYESIFSGEQDVQLTSKRKKLTVFFSDIVDFTDTTDKMESEDLSELLNDYLNDMTQIALNHGATVDKYIGDAIMLFFGDPKSNGIREDAVACVNMALEMKEHMQVLHYRWKNRGFTKPFQIRMGIHTGYCTVGNFGSENRLEYTIIGSSVNLASRIESTAQPDEILVSEETKLLANEVFEFIDRTQITPKGFLRPVSLFSVEGKKAAADEGEKKPLIDYEIENMSIEEKIRLKNELNTLLKRL